MKEKRERRRIKSEGGPHERTALLSDLSSHPQGEGEEEMGGVTFTSQFLRGWKTEGGGARGDEEDRQGTRSNCSPSLYLFKNRRKGSIAK